MNQPRDYESDSPIHRLIGRGVGDGGTASDAARFEDKHPAVDRYIAGNGGPFGLRHAQMELALNYSEIARPDTGRSHYPDSIASISSKEVATALQQTREQYLGNGRTAETNQTDRTVGGMDPQRLQQQLADLGYLQPQAMSGAFDRNTAQALAAAQKDFGLQADGIPGARTQEALDKASKLLVTDPTHDDRKLYQSAYNALQTLPAGNFANEQELRNAAAAVTDMAKVQKMSSVDYATRSNHGGWVVGQGAQDNNPTGLRFSVDPEQVKSQTVRESSQNINDFNAQQRSLQGVQPTSQPEVAPHHSPHQLSSLNR
jgi:peptidoglycan hydrolase-like protein with peptidoglycan-binding domain